MIPEKTAMIAIAIDAAQWIITAGVGVWVYLVGRDQVRRQSLAEMEGRIEKRLDTIDNSLAAATAEKVESAPGRAAATNGAATNRKG